MLLLEHKPIVTRGYIAVAKLYRNFDGWFDGLPWVAELQPMSIADAIGLGHAPKWTVDERGFCWPGKEDIYDLPVLALN